ncbi:MAG: type II toxin-antitoxin system VapC family toxin [Tepidisphaeraceae bacterium]
MGSITLPTSGSVYIDSPIAIYSVERRPQFWPRLEPFWLSLQRGAPLRVVTSELTVLESFIVPLRDADVVRQAEFDSFFASGAVEVLPITRPLLMEAARLRATARHLRTPDAIHVATALLSRCNTFLTNDAGPRSLPGVSTTYLGDVTP